MTLRSQVQNPDDRVLAEQVRDLRATLPKPDKKSKTPVKPPSPRLMPELMKDAMKDPKLRYAPP